MQWREARSEFPDRWLLVEAIRAHTEEDRREVEDLAVIGTFEESDIAWRRCLELQRGDPPRELYVAHTSRERLEIEERRWVGIRGA